MGCGASKSANGGDVPHFLVLPQKDSDAGKRVRQEQLARTRQAYEMEYSDWLPPHVKGIPERERNRDRAMTHLADLFVDLKGDAAKMNFAKPLHLLDNVFDSCENPFDDWIEIYPAQASENFRSDIPSVSKRWRSDKEYGRQKLNGINPLMIKRYRPQPNFPVTDALVAGSTKGVSLEALHSAKRLYMIDYGFLQGVTGTATDTTWVTPIMLFLVDDDKDLVPIAIQLFQTPSAENPIFTPSDHPGLWQLVKWFCQSADGAVHQSVMHLLCTHLIMEVIFVAARRTLAERHPIHELIDGHFWFTVLINFSARNSLMVPEGQLPKLYPQGYEGMKQLVRGFNSTWDWNRYVIPEVLKHHDTLDAEALPKYYFRDDALKLWPAVESYVGNVVNLAYPSDAEVVADPELKAFAEEFQRGTTWQNLPLTNGVFATKAQLTRFLTMVVFTVSCTHAAVNNGQYDILGYVPNYPPKLHLPAPRSKSEQYTDAQLAKALPDYDASVVQISFFHAVSTPTEPSKRLGQYPADFLMELPGGVSTVKHFQQALQKISDEIKQRNHTLPVPYTYLDPAQIAGGVAV